MKAYLNGSGNKPAKIINNLACVRISSLSSVSSVAKVFR
jgi:hypothetical protein